MFVERGVLYFFLHTEHGMLAWTDRAANTSIQKYTAEPMILPRSAGGFGFLTQTAVPLSALFGAERFDISSSAWK